MTAVAEIPPPSALLQEDQIPLNKAQAEIPGRPSLPTLYRWWKKGIGGVRLEVVKVGGKPFTSKQALARFFDRCTNPAGAAEREVRVESRRAHDRAVAALDAEGL